MRVVHRNPRAYDKMFVEIAFRRHGPEWEREGRKAPVDASIRDSSCAVHGSPFGLGHGKRRGAIDQRMAGHVAGGNVIRVDGPGVKEAEMRGIDVAFQAL